MTLCRLSCLRQAAFLLRRVPQEGNGIGYQLFENVEESVIRFDFDQLRVRVGGGEVCVSSWMGTTSSCTPWNIRAGWLKSGVAGYCRASAIRPQ